MYYFKLYKDKSAPTRTFSRCVKCNGCYLSSYCVNQTGCTRCDSGYSQVTKYFPGSGNNYLDCQYNGGSSSEGGAAFAAFVLCMLPIVIVVLIVMCIVKCVKANRTIYVGNGAYQQPSISIAQPVLSTPIYSQPAPIYTQPPPPVYAQQPNPMYGYQDQQPQNYGSNQMGNPNYGTGNQNYPTF